MRKRRFTGKLMVTVLRDANRTSVGDAAKKHNVSVADFLHLTCALCSDGCQRRQASHGCWRRLNLDSGGCGVKLGLVKRLFHGFPGTRPG